MTSELTGKKVTFHASRILKGNPIKGIVLWEDDEWIAVTLAHTIEGAVNVWLKGEEKVFRKELIFGGIKEIK